MILPFSADRPLTRVAAASSGTALPQWPPGSVGSLAALGRVAGAPGPSIEGGGDDIRGSQPERFAIVIQAVVVGEPEQLQSALTADAIGWSPALSYTSRAEAVLSLHEHPAALSVTEFDVVRLLRPSPFLVAEWHLAAVHDQPFLVADDRLIDVSERPVHLHGTTVAKVRGLRIEAVHTYYDEAALVEQVLLGVES